MSKSIPVEHVHALKTQTNVYFSWDTKNVKNGIKAHIVFIGVLDPNYVSFRCYEQNVAIFLKIGV